MDLVGCQKALGLPQSDERLLPAVALLLGGRVLLGRGAILGGRITREPRELVRVVVVGGFEDILHPRLLPRKNGRS